MDSWIIAHAPVKFLVAGMGDALGTYFEARACYRTDAPSLENGGITRSAMALCELCYENLRNYGAQAKMSVEKQVVTPPGCHHRNQCVSVRGGGRIMEAWPAPIPSTTGSPPWAATALPMGTV